MKLSCTAIALIAVAITPWACAEDAPRPLTAIIGALGNEVHSVEKLMTIEERQTHLGLRFTVGTLNGRRVVVAESGVGKVNAAMTATLLIDHFHPTEIVCSGVAGSVGPKLVPGDIVIGERVALHDAGDLIGDTFKPQGLKNPVNGQRNPVFLPCDPRLLALAQKAASTVSFPPNELAPDKAKPHVSTGTIVTGDIFVASTAKRNELRERFQADAVEMEGAAVGQVCFEQGVPFLAIRTVSDSADGNAQVDFEQFARVAARNSALLVGELVKLLVDGAAVPAKAP